MFFGLILSLPHSFEDTVISTSDGTLSAVMRERHLPLVVGTSPSNEREDGGKLTMVFHNWQCGQVSRLLQRQCLPELLHFDPIPIEYTVGIAVALHWRLVQNCLKTV